MRTMLVTGMACLVALAAAARAGEEDQATAEAKPAAEQEASVVVPATEAQKTAKAEEEPFTPPPGWQPKKRGKFVVYCKKQTQMGSRVPTEKCYDEQGIRDMLAAQREDREKVDQMRRICGSMDACGGGG
jgi:hypothetical protein